MVSEFDVVSMPRHGMLCCPCLFQERLTHQLADEVSQLTGAAGVLVLAEAVHLCMVARGVEKHASSTCTVAVRGSLAADSAVRRELMLSCCL